MVWGNSSEPVRPGAENVWLHSSLPFGQGVEIFFAIRMRKKYYSLADCLDGLCSAGYNHSGDGRGNCFLLLRSHPARRHSYGPASRTCSVQVGRDGAIKLHYHECCLSSFPRQSKQVLWLSQQPQRFVSSRAVLTCSICSGVGYWLYLHRR